MGDRLLIHVGELEWELVVLALSDKARSGKMWPAACMRNRNKVWRAGKPIWNGGACNSIRLLRSKDDRPRKTGAGYVDFSESLE